MSTRGVYTFIDADGDTYHVYKHHDNYPHSEHGAVAAIAKALPYAWPLPRFEADEFATAFIAANKLKGGGGVRLTTHYKDHGDLEYRYEIKMLGHKLFVTIYERDWKNDSYNWKDAADIDNLLKTYVIGEDIAREAE